MGRFLSWVVDRLNWTLAAVTIFGLLGAYAGWSNVARIRDVEANGVETTAIIEGATRNTRRRGSGDGETYDLKLAWRDTKGEVQKAEKVAISSTFAGQIISGDTITRATVRIKYVRDAAIKPIVLEDAARRAETDDFIMRLGFGIAAFGVVCSALFLFINRRRRGVAASPEA